MKNHSPFHSYRKHTSLLLAAVFIITLSVSTAFIIEHASHHCTGDDCPICSVLNLAETVLSSVRSEPASAEAAVPAKSLYALQLSCCPIVLLHTAVTPVSVNIRSNT